MSAIRSSIPIVRSRRYGTSRQVTARHGRFLQRSCCYVVASRDEFISQQAVLCV